MIHLPLALICGLAFALAGEPNLASLAAGRSKAPKSKRVYTDIDLKNAKGRISTSRLPLPKGKDGLSNPPQASDGTPTGEAPPAAGPPDSAEPPAPESPAQETSVPQPAEPVDPAARRTKLENRIRGLAAELASVREELRRNQRQLDQAGQDPKQRERIAAEVEAGVMKSNELESELRSTRAELDALKSNRPPK